MCAILGCQERAGMSWAWLIFGSANLSNLHRPRPITQPGAPFKTCLVFLLSFCYCAARSFPPFTQCLVVHHLLALVSCASNPDHQPCPSSCSAGSWTPFHTSQVWADETSLLHPDLLLLFDTQLPSRPEHGCRGTGFHVTRLHHSLIWSAST